MVSFESKSSRHHNSFRGKSFKVAKCEFNILSRLERFGRIEYQSRMSYNYFPAISDATKSSASFDKKSTHSKRDLDYYSMRDNILSTHKIHI